MGTSAAKIANNILGRPLETEFWKERGAKTIISALDRLVNEFKVPEDEACEIIVDVWNAACEEYGE